MPYDAFAASDGHLLVAVGNDAQFLRFCDCIGAPEIGADPQYATNLLRIENRDSLTEKLAAVLNTLPKDEILERMHKAKVPGGPIHTLDEALGSDQAKARGAVIDMARDDVAGGHVQLLGNPLNLSVTPVRYAKPPPRFGEDTKMVLDALRDGKSIKP